MNLPSLKPLILIERLGAYGMAKIIFTFYVSHMQ